MGIGRTLLRAATWWNSATLNTSLYTWRKGEKVGEDDQGNSYYQAEGGKKRWVIFDGEAEASKVSPEWHGWLHHTWDHPPTKAPLPKKDWEKPHLPNLTGTSAAYAPAGSIRQPEPKARQDYEAWQPE